MNILQVSCEGLGRGGVQKVIMDITRQLSKKNKIDIVLFTNEKRYYDEEFVGHGGIIYRIPKNNSKYRLINKLDYYIRGPRILYKMIKILKNANYDVIHCHNEYESGICMLAAYLCRVKVRIVHLHRSDYNLGKKKIITLFYEKILRFFLEKYSTKIICCSENTKNSFFINKNKYIFNKIIVINNCIDLKEFNIPKFWEKDKFILTHIGQFCDNKNQLFLINIMNELRKKIDNVQLNLVGFGEEYKKMLLNRISELKLNKYIKIFPHDINIPQILSKTDVFLFPSKSEGLGIALLEAQAMNIYCISSDTVSKETNCGLIIFKSLDNSEEWVNTIVDIKNKKICLKLNKEKMQQMDISNYINKIELIYSNV